MADNLTTQSATLATVPASSAIATDDVAGVHFQKVKIDVGGDGATAALSDSNPLPISDAGGSVTVDGTVAVSSLPAGSQAAQTAITVDYDTGAGTQSMPMQGLALPASGGAVAGGTFTNPVRTDPTGTTAQPVTDAGGSLTVDGSVAIGSALPAGNNNIGDVDIASVPAPLSTTGGGVEASALRVTLASDSTGVLSVDDNGGSLTVDGTVTVNAGTDLNTSALALESGGNLAAQTTALQLLDNLVLAEDAAHTTGDPGLMAFAVRRDANTSLVGTDGDYAPLQVNADGSLKVAITAGAGSGGTSLADDAAFTPASTSFTPVGGIVTSDSVDAGDGGAFAMLANRQQKVTLFDSAGVELSVGGGTQYTENAAAAANPVGNALMLVREDARAGSLTTTDGDNVAARGTNAGELYVKHVDAIPVTDNGASLTVDGSVSLTGSLPAGTNNIGDVDVLSVPAPLNLTGGGVEASALRVTLANDSTGVLSVDDNGGSLTVDGTVAVSSLPAIPAGNNNIGDVDVASIAAGDNNIGNVDIVTMPNVTLAAGTNTNEVVGDAAHGAAAAGNPVLIGIEGRSTDPAAVDSGDVSRVLATLLGKQINYPWALPPSTWSYAAASGGIVNTTGVTAKAAAGAGVRNYITQIQAINGHATVSTDVQIRDGASGTVLWRGFAQAAGGGCAAKFDPPLRGTANTLVEVACGTTGSATYINLQGFTAGE